MRGGERGGFPGLPEGAIPCVWMSAGLVAWKLCDRDGDCERCPFDRAFRGLGAPEADAPAAAASGWAFPGDRRYHPAGHGWALAVAPDRVRIGADAFVARLVEHPAAVVLPAAGGRLARGHAACWLGDGDDLVPIAAPVSGVVAVRNLRVQADPALLGAAPYGDGWLLEVACDAASELGALAPADRARAAAEGAWEAFTAGAARHLDRGRAAVGRTLPDGGEPLGSLRAMLGEAHWRELVRRALGG
jgi:glycine cleavage system H protein